LTRRSRLQCHPRRSTPLAEAEGPGTHDLQRNAVKIADPRASLQAVGNYLRHHPQSTRRTRRSRRPLPDCRLRPKADANAAAGAWRCRLFLRTGRRDCGRACDSVFRAQGRFDALDQPLSLGRAPRRPEEGVDADDRQVRFHRRRQRCRGHAGQPRVLGLHGRTVGSWPLRIVDEFRKELGRDNVTDPQVEGRGRADRSEPVDESRTSPVLRRGEQTPAAGKDKPTPGAAAGGALRSQLICLETSASLCVGPWHHCPPLHPAAPLCAALSRPQARSSNGIAASAARSSRLSARISLLWVSGPHQTANVVTSDRKMT
jgi:hypothetical protein